MFIALATNGLLLPARDAAARKVISNNDDGMTERVLRWTTNRCALKLMVVTVLRRQARLDCAARLLAFAIIEQAVHDLNNAHHDSTSYFGRSQFLAHCQIVELHPGYALRILRDSGLLRVRPAGHRGIA